MQKSKLLSQLRRQPGMAFDHALHFVCPGLHIPVAFIDRTAEERNSYWPLKREFLLGPEASDDEFAKCLNRLRSWEADGIAYECDPRHLEMLVETLGLGDRRAKACSTPCERKELDEAEEATDLDAEAGTMLRRLTARTNYVAQSSFTLRRSAPEE